MVSLQQHSLKVLLLLLILVTSFSCYKNDERNVDYIPNELKGYAYFKSGSYWTYLNNVTGEIDSCSTTSDPYTYLYDSGSHDDALKETCEITYQGTFLVHTRLSFNYYRIVVHTMFYEAIIPRSFEPGEIFYFGGSTLTNMPTIDSLEINGSMFHNIFVTEYKEPPLLIRTYFAKNIGIIMLTRSQYGNDTTWTIKEFHTVQ